MALIAGASHALKYKRQNPHASEQEIVQHVIQTSDEILGNMD